MWRKVFFWLFLIVSFVVEAYFVWQGKGVLMMPNEIYAPAFFGVCFGLNLVVVTLYFATYKNDFEQNRFLVKMVVGAVIFAGAGIVFVPEEIVVGEQVSSAEFVNGQAVVESIRSFKNDNKITVKIKGDDGIERNLSYFKDTVNRDDFWGSGIHMDLIADGERKADFRYVSKDFQFSFLGIPLGSVHNGKNELYVTLHLPVDGKDVVGTI